MQDCCSYKVGYRLERPSIDQIRSAYEALTKATMITTAKTTRGLIITICNYDFYQNPTNYETHNENPTKTLRSQSTPHTIYKNVKNDKNEKKFIKPSVEEICAYCLERKNNIDAQYFYDKNESIGWVIGKNRTPMKDWRATIRTWERNNHKGNGSHFPGWGECPQEGRL